MKSLVLLSLLAVAFAAQNRGLSEITTATAISVAVTAQFPDAAAAPTLQTFSYLTTYDSSVATTAFSVSGKGFYVGNNTVVGGAITFTSSGNTVVVPFSAASSEGNVTFSPYFVSIYPIFLNAGPYAVSVQLVTSASVQLYTVTLPGGAAFPTLAATPYVPITAAVLTLVNPQSGGCDNTGCDAGLNGTLAVTPARSGSWSTYLRPTAATSGVIYSSLTNAPSGVSDLNVNTITYLATNIGGWVSGAFSSADSQLASESLLPRNAALQVSGTWYETNPAKSTRFAEGAAGLPASVTVTAGSTDVLAPACTLVSVGPATVNTVNLPVQLTVTLTCADEAGGSGLWTKGVFLTGTVTSGNGGTDVITTGAFTTATNTDIMVPPYITGTLAITGVFAVDNAGNAVVYGSCNGVSGYDTLGCSGGGGGSSGASQAVVSLFALAFAAIVALFA